MLPVWFKVFFAKPRRPQPRRMQSPASVVAEDSPPPPPRASAGAVSPPPPLPARRSAPRRSPSMDSLPTCDLQAARSSPPAASVQSQSSQPRGAPLAGRQRRGGRPAAGAELAARRRGGRCGVLYFFTTVLRTSLSSISPDLCTGARRGRTTSARTCGSGGRTGSGGPGGTGAAAGCGTCPRRPPGPSQKRRTA